MNGLVTSNNTLSARLLTVLPRDWTSFRSAWNTKPEPERSKDNSLVMMISEAAQRKLEKVFQEITALTARTTTRRKRRFVPSNYHQNRQSTSRNQFTSYTRKTEITCWTCGGNVLGRPRPGRQQQTSVKCLWLK